MVLGANVEPYGGGRWRKITGVKAAYSENFGNSLLFDVTSVVSPATKRVPPYSFSIRLSTPNYAPVAPLPDTTINNSFKLELRLRFAWESTDLVNEGSGHSSHAISYYSVGFGRHFATSFLYEDVSLSHRNFITQLPTLAPISLLL